MPIEDFHGETFVAFCDISGFKQYMKEPRKAAITLHNFYNGGFNILRNQIADQTKVDGIFISDCAVMFARPEEAPIQEKLHQMLHVVEQLNKAMLRHDLMLTTSIAYGHFDYTQRIEFEGIEKNLLMGNPYIEAYLDGSSGKASALEADLHVTKSRSQERDELILTGTPFSSRHEYSLSPQCTAHVSETTYHLPVGLPDP